MTGRHAAPRPPGQRRAVTAALALSGVVVMGVAAGGQQHPPQAPRLEHPDPHTIAARATPGRPALPRSIPVHVEIAAIGVSSDLVQLGLAKGGALQVPSGSAYDHAGWYRYSPTPGEPGPAVLAGHVDSRRGPSVFFRLGALSPGARVTVTRTDGSQVVFVVTDVHRYPKTAFPTQLVYGRTAGPELRLVTCGGAFDARSGHYLDNVVVLATLVGGSAAQA